MKQLKKAVAITVVLAIIMTCCGAFGAFAVDDSSSGEVSALTGASVRINTVKYEMSGSDLAVYSADMRFRSSLTVSQDVVLKEFGYVYTLSQYLNNNVRLKYNELEDKLSSTEGFVLEKDADYGYSAAAKSYSLVVWNSSNETESNGNYTKTVNSETGDITYTYNLVLNVLKKWFTYHAFAARPYYIYEDKTTGKDVIVYGEMYSRCLKYTAYTAYNAKGADGKYIESTDTRVTLAEILGYRTPGGTDWY